MPVGTFDAGVAVNSDDTGYWKITKEPFASVVTQRQFGFLALVGAPEVDTQLNFGATKVKQIPARIKTDVLRNMKPEIDDFGEFPYKFTVNGAISGMSAGSNQNLTLDDTSGLKAGMTLQNPTTGAIVRVQSITSSTVVVVRPAAGGPSGDGSDDIADNEVLHLGGGAMEDGFSYGDGLRASPQNVFNYMQTMKDEFGIGIVREQTRMEPNNSNWFDVLKFQTRVLHNQQLELQHLFGQRAVNTQLVSGETVYFAHGLTGFSSREVVADGSLSLDEWDTEVHPNILAKGGGDYMALGGRQPLAALAKIGRDFIRTSREETTVGNRVTKIESTNGMVELVGTEPMNDRPGQLLMFKPGLIRMKVLGELNNAFIENVGARSAAKRTNAYVTSSCIIPRNYEHICIVSGVFA